MLEINQLCYTVAEGDRSRKILDCVDLSVARGASMALLGRSGSGKSTLLNLISGIDRPDSGEIRVLDQQISTLREPELTLFRRRHIGFIYQFFHLIPTLTVAENIALVPELNRVPPQRTQQRVEQLLLQVGLTNLAQRFPDQLSGGEQQRVAIARALAHCPQLLLADEPTGNLDAQTGREVMRLLNQLVEQQGVTLILVTHSRAVAENATRILTLERGRLTDQTGDFAW